MKHVANVMRMNDWNTNQESTVGRIFVKGRGKTKKHLIVWLNGNEEVFGGNYYDACASGLSAHPWNFIRPV
ncbi:MULTISPECIES: hypothetical protein [Neisseria]|jgi:site-specific recombinase, phage integrase family|uniref:hypothetical protein n=2 Tax=Neisseriaceae TaxID=481 RepID=UPI0007A5F0D3|nr:MULTISPECIES: hypothetical protein [Neisseria]DAT70369.1 MAG TPA: hypothetical protein [Bacteriophage sp.]